MAVLNLSTVLVLFCYIAVIFFCFSFNPSLAAISDIFITLSDVLKKLKCVIVCYNSQIIIDHSEKDGVDKEGE